MLKKTVFNVVVMILFALLSTKSVYAENSRMYAGKKPKDVATEQLESEIHQGQEIKLTDVIQNPTFYIGKAVEWTGYVEEVKKVGNTSRIIVNSNYDVDPNSNMNYCFEIVVKEKLPQDERISFDSEVTVVGKVKKLDKIKLKSNFSPKRQPVVEASEVTFTRYKYAQPLIIRY